MSRRQPEPLTAEHRLYLTQRGWEQIDEGWINDDNIFRCERCYGPGDVCIVTAINPLEGARGGYRLATCTGCRQKNVACPLVSAVVRPRYHWTGLEWERAVLGLRYGGSYTLGSSVADTDTDANDTQVRQSLYDTNQDIARRSSSASPFQRSAGRLIEPPPSWFATEPIRDGPTSGDPHPTNHRPPHSSDEPSPTDASDFLQSLPESNDSDGLHDSISHVYQYHERATRVDRGLYRSPEIPEPEPEPEAMVVDPEPPINYDDIDFWNNDEGPVPYDAQFDDIDDYFVMYERDVQATLHQRRPTRGPARGPAPGRPSAPTPRPQAQQRAEQLQERAAFIVPMEEDLMAVDPQPGAHRSPASTNNPHGRQSPLRQIALVQRMSALAPRSGVLSEILDQASEVDMMRYLDGRLRAQNLDDRTLATILAIRAIVGAAYGSRRR